MYNIIYSAIVARCWRLIHVILETNKTLQQLCATIVDLTTEHLITIPAAAYASMLHTLHWLQYLQHRACFTRCTDYNIYNTVHTSHAALHLRPSVSYIISWDIVTMCDESINHHCSAYAAHTLCMQPATISGLVTQTLHDASYKLAQKFTH